MMKWAGLNDGEEIWHKMGIVHATHQPLEMTRSCI